MSRDLKIYRALTAMLAVIGQSESHTSVGVAELSAWTDAAALRQVEALARQALDALNEADGAAASDSRSSVAIESMARGVPKLTVKAYTGSPLETAAADALETWRRLAADVAEGAATVAAPTNGEAVLS